MDDNERIVYSLFWRIVAGIVGLVVLLIAAYNIHADFQRAQVLGKNISPAGVNCAFNGNPVTCALLTQQSQGK